LFDAFSSREPVSTSLESALGHDAKRLAGGLSLAALIGGPHCI
jgi:hypothetical protein